MNIDGLIRELGPELRIATPLGLGKPNALLNALFDRVKGDPSLHLTLFTALSLNPPAPGDGLKAAFLKPFIDRHFGADYPALKYALGELPPNMRVHEFYMQAGAYLGAPARQRDYVSVNYTHVAKAVLQMDVQCVLQLIAKRGDRYSLSCNPDLTLDLVDLYRSAGKSLRVIGVTHPDLPFMEGDAEVEASFFSEIIEGPRHELFALPRRPVDRVDHAIGQHASTLVEDGGTLQVGIGSLGDAVTYALIKRHEREPFVEGLYGLSEMVSDPFMHLHRAGILKRTVAGGTFLHGAFFLGSKPFYDWLREGDPGIAMTRVSTVNALHDVAQRKKARFLNICMQATLLGGAASETLEDGRVVSGVGGQFNFVTMAHELPGARSILMLRSTRESHGKRLSNIVWSHGMLTIPRHLRDIFVTEYGVADLRGKSDEDCIRAMLDIAHAEFQDELAFFARKSGKLGAWKPARHNDELHGDFPPFPFGSDFTPEEETLALALGRLENVSKPELLGLIWRGLAAHGFDKELSRVPDIPLLERAALKGALA